MRYLDDIPLTDPLHILPLQQLFGSDGHVVEVTETHGLRGRILSHKIVFLYLDLVCSSMFPSFLSTAPFSSFYCPLLLLLLPPSPSTSPFLLLPPISPSCPTSPPPPPQHDDPEDEPGQNHLKAAKRFGDLIVLSEVSQ